MDSSVSGSARAASSYISSEWLKLIVANAEQFGILSIVTALAVRFLFYEDWEENYRIRKTYMEELERASEMSESDSVSVDTNTSERSTLRPHTHEMDRSSNSTDEGISLSTISQRRMSATFERRLSSSLERRLSGSKTHMGHRAVDRVSMSLGQFDTCSESAWSGVYINNDT